MLVIILKGLSHKRLIWNFWNLWIVINSEPKNHLHLFVSGANVHLFDNIQTTPDFGVCQHHNLLNSTQLWMNDMKCYKSFKIKRIRVRTNKNICCWYVQVKAENTLDLSVEVSQVPNLQIIQVKTLLSLSTYWISLSKW